MLVFGQLLKFSVLFFQELSIKKDGERGRLNSSEFINLFKEIATRPEIYFLLVR